MGALALLAATGAVLTTGALSSALDREPDPVFADRTVQSVPGVRPEAEPRAAEPAVDPAVTHSERPPATPSEPMPAGMWQIQVGAFRNTVAAEAHLRALESGVPELAGLDAIHQLRGGVNRVRIGGIGDEEAARRLCSRIAAAGRGCFVVRPKG